MTGNVPILVEVLFLSQLLQRKGKKRKCARSDRKVMDDSERGQNGKQANKSYSYQHSNYAYV
ncbi:MAG: hypothetical protein ACJ71D_07390 [Nitrososphaera sp.]